ncbi:hypothetical protein BJ508DRAFT_414119 [Ascobolus immersus RN42]|uniref:Uncharacterized protein n=1 Tax=Ascobolus immersus RN42 TaxID=1160509 RepID=A0A3N4I8V0_ASCIM|nr:hypothetical protein BJ508DRAFT_414119 [Ascobolus immersus RN42]
MVTITVGQIAGVISFSVLLLSVVLPLIIIAVLVGFLRETNSAVTWSVVCRFVQGTWWPTVLRSDSTAWHGVDRKVLYLTISSTLSILLLGLASVVTPLGLDEGIVATTHKNLPFTSFKDPGIIGVGTMDREGYVYSRLCGSQYYLSCPSQQPPKGVVFNPKWRVFETENPNITEVEQQMVDVSSEVPTNLTEAFKVPKEFSSHNTVAGPFDVQYRSFKKVYDRLVTGARRAVYINNGKPYVVPDYRPFGQNALKSEYQVIEGGIVDRINGGYGFLNHSRPVGTLYRSDWDADVLWMEPESVCVPNNISIRYTFGNRPMESWTRASSVMSEVSIRDYGGLKDLPLEYPVLDLNRSQDDPQLWARAWKAAVISNFNVYGPLRLKRPDIPKTDKIMSYNITAFINEEFTMQPDLPIVERFGARFSDGLLPFFKDLKQDQLNNTALQINPDLPSRGYGGGDPVGIQTIHSDSYFLITPGIPLPGPSAAHQRRDPGTRWEHHVYTCVTALTASVKRVSFSYNATNETISVLNVDNLPATEPTPLWGMENPRWNISDVQPVWGIVSEDSTSNPALSTIRKSKFYHPAGSGSIFGELMGTLALPVVGLTALERMFEIFYRKTSALQATNGVEYGTYSGAANYEAYQRWVETTKSPEKAWKMIHVIWADIMGNMAVGTNSIPAQDSLPVLVWERQILYDIRFAIPAFIFLLVFLVFITSLLYLVVTKKTSIENVRQLVNMTGTGRVITNLQSPGVVAPNAKTREWVTGAGQEVVRVPYRMGEYAAVEEEAQEEGRTYGPEKGGADVGGAEVSEGNHSSWRNKR